MQIETIAISKLKPYEKNAKLHPQEQIEQIKKSIEMYGNNDPIAVWGEDNTIVEGHGRYIALKQLGETTAEIIRLDHLTDEQRREYMLVHNKLTMNTDFDFDILAEELDDLDFGGFDFGFEFDDADDPLEIIEDEAPEPPEEPTTKLGDIYQLGDHRLICGDSTDVNVIERLMDGEIADIGFTSPPYNAGTTATEVATGKQTKYNGNSDSMGESEYTDFINSYIHCAMGHCRYVFMNVQSIAGNKLSLIDVLADNRNIYADTIIWDKQHGQPAMANNVLNSVYEYIHIFSDKGNRAVGTIDFRGTIDNILHLPAQRKNEYADIHNATFSVEFASWFISRFAKESVFDSFGGTGTTMIACEQLNRRCYMCELDERYCDVIVQRWENFTGQKAVLLNG